MRTTIQPCGRSKALGYCLLNLATFPSGVPRWRELPGSWLALQRRLAVNHVLVASAENGKVVGAVEVHTPAYQQLRAPKGAYTPEQLAKLQPYMASLAVREDVRGRGIGRELVEAAVDAVRSSSYTGEHMILGVAENNTAAVKLYEACDFETMSAPGCEVRLMRRRLRPPSRATWLDLN